MVYEQIRLSCDPTISRISAKAAGIELRVPTNFRNSILVIVVTALFPLIFSLVTGFPSVRLVLPRAPQFAGFGNLADLVTDGRSGRSHPPVPPAGRWNRGCLTWSGRVAVTANQLSFSLMQHDQNGAVDCEDCDHRPSIAVKLERVLCLFGCVPYRLAHTPQGIGHLRLALILEWEATHIG